MPLLDLQRRFRELGRIRLGVQQKASNGKMRPAKLSTFRLTSPSQALINAAADIYGGEARAWDNNGRSEFEVITNVSQFQVIVPPGQVLSQFWEQWSGGGCLKRCDGERELLSDSPCQCPADYDERRELAAKGQACKPTTRLNLILRELPDIGVWRLESHGFYAAVELAGTAELLEMATKAGRMIPAVLRLDTREKRTPGQPTMKWVVPVVEINASFGQVAEALGVLPTPALPTPSSPPMAALPERTERGGGPEGLPALPRSPKGRQKTELPSERPALPSDPSFRHEEEQPITMAEAPPAKPVASDAAAKRGQAVHMAAKKRNIEEPLLRDLIEHVSQGRTRSAKELDDNEAGQIQVLMFKVATGKAQLRYDENGKIEL